MYIKNNKYYNFYKNIIEIAKCHTSQIALSTTKDKKVREAERD